MKGKQLMKISFHKYVYTNRFNGRVLERWENFTDMDTALLSFVDCFRHHLGRKPTKNQIGRMENEHLVTAKSGQLLYEFSFCIAK